jgi:hypothetical protein
VIPTWLAILVILALNWFAAFGVIGWVTLKSVERNTGCRRPWNWRVLVGPWAYYPWLDRARHRYDRPRRHWLRRLGQWLGFIT